MIALRTGNQMIAEGAVHAGCRFFAGYPITPASGIYKSMIDLLQKRGDLAISAPDEISALAYCVGASLRGFKAFTATSGPGWALMIETVQYALMTETPIVIALVQRLGPSTGGATQGAQGDVLFAEFCTSGGYTIPILSPGSAAECFDLTVTAFNWAEQLRSPVVLLTDKEVAMTSEPVDYDLLSSAPVLTRVSAGADESGSLRTYDFARLSDVPVFAEVGGSHKVTATGSAHNKRGQLRKNDSETLLVLQHLEEKIQSRKQDLSLVRREGEKDASTVLISYGITARAMNEAAEAARNAGLDVSALTLHSLFPVPEKAILEATANARRIVVPEENFGGQYRTMIQHLFGHKEVVGVNKIGSMITPREIYDAIS